MSPGGVGFDINCGVRLIRTNLTLADVDPVKEELAQVHSRARTDLEPFSLRGLLLFDIPCRIMLFKR